MSDIAIRAQNLGKRYRLGQRASYHRFSDLITHTALWPWRIVQSLAGPRSGSASGGGGGGGRSDILWALKDVSFDVRKGEVVGVIGRNGAGKSTLLKILSRITEPTEGRVEIRGRIGSLLEVGTGFHPELTGRENIYLNGAVLGMRRVEIARKFDEIVAFAETERFLDTPVKHYSSGMYMRLAFAVAAHLEPEILLVDEVLAVGDAAFQKKCLTKMDSVAREGRTVLFVSHNMAVMSNLCKTIILLKEGKVEAHGPADQVVPLYLGAMNASPAVAEVKIADHLESWGGSKRIRLRTVTLLDSEFNMFVVRWKQPIRVELELEVLEPANNVILSIAVSKNGVEIFGCHHNDDGAELHTFERGVYRVQVEIENPLRAGVYRLSIGADTAIGSVPIFHVAEAAQFEVLDIGEGDKIQPQYGTAPVNGQATWSAARKCAGSAAP